MIDGVTNSAHAVTRPTGSDTARAGEEARRANERPVQEDALELSEAARKRMGRSESMPIRMALVERVRAEIAAGTYLTDDKLTAAVSRVHEETFVVT